MKKLIPMVEFVLEQTEQHRFKDDCEFAYVVRNYAKFLSQPLELGMFVPCDEDGNILEKPKTPWQDFIIHEEIHEKYHIKLKEFQIAKTKVLFEGFEDEYNAIKSPNGYLDVSKLKGMTIENIIGSELTLTDSAIKQLGL